MTDTSEPHQDHVHKSVLTQPELQCCTYSAIQFLLIRIKYTSNAITEIFLHTKWIKNAPPSFPMDLKSAFKNAFSLHQAGELAKARQIYQGILLVNPSHFDALHLSGVIAMQMGNLDTALNLIRKAIQINPAIANAHYNLGMVYKKLNQPQEALRSFEAAIERQPNYHEALSNKGVLLQESYQLAEALRFFELAIGLAPNYAEAHNSMGVVYKLQDNLAKALHCFELAIRLKPNLVEAHANRATIMQELGNLPEALNSIAQTLAYNPNQDFLAGKALNLLMKMCQWHGFDACLAGIQSDVQQGKKIISPFSLMSLVDSARLHLECAQILAKANAIENVPETNFERSHQNTRKIKIGYYSADFHNHATTHLMIELLENHDKSKFEVHGFSFGPQKKDAMYHRLFQAFDHFYDVHTMTDQAVAELSRDLNMDIAIDLKGYTTDGRPGIFAHRCAPIQVSYLGYPGTMGVSHFDYIMVDKIVLPEDQLAHYTEHPVYLPNSYQCNDSQRVIANVEGDRADFGLPAEGFVFCCFNNNHKIMPVVFDIWLRLLQAVPGSVLWLLEDNPWVSQNLRQYAQTKNIAPERLVFAPRMPSDQHLGRHQFADLFLDTWPYNAHTTASDALWAGLPMVTFAGETFPARVAASLLHAIGLPELVTHSLKDYEQLALSLASSPEQIKALKIRLSQNRLSSSLFDGKRMARDMEQAYQKMVARFNEGLPPATIDLSVYD
ncbi:MAG: tetratricopeptide repeat protein [Limnohabitans sp.]